VTIKLKFLQLVVLLLTFFLDDFFIPNPKNRKLNTAKKGAAGSNNIDDIKGCQINPEQFKTSRAEQGSMYLLTTVSAICRLFGAK
jgi:hypothetical protein